MESFLSFYALETDLRFKYLDFGIHFKVSIIENVLHSERIITLFLGKRFWSKKSPQFWAHSITAEKSNTRYKVPIS